MAVLSTIFNLFFLLVVLGLLWLLRRTKFQSPIILVFLFGILLLVLSLIAALLSPAVYFGQLQLMAWAIFFIFPIYLLSAAFLFSKSKPAFAVSSACLGMGILAIGLYASLVEPHQLDISNLAISSPKLKESIRVAVIADIQTDTPGEYEEKVLSIVMSAQPDLILLAGDYLQVMEVDDYPAVQKKLHDIFLREGLDAPLGTYAVQGNVDPDILWQDLFDGLPISIFRETSSIDLGPVVLTGLTLEDSGNTYLSIEGKEKYHIVLGHRPDFSLGEINADLLIAGHTHGGQFDIPFIGPLATLSAVPRSWASGVTTISPGKNLVVSRGIGMERGNAPRMRLNCRPELVIVDLVPSKE